MRFLLIPLLVAKAWAIPANCQLTLVDAATNPGFNALSITVDPGAEGQLEDTDTSILTGTIDAAFDVDIINHTTSEITLSNGLVNLSDCSFSRSEYFPIILKNIAYTADTTGLKAEIYTFDPPGASIVIDDEFEAFDQAFIVNQGTLTGEVVETPGPTTPFTQDYAVEPINGAGADGELGTVTLTPNGGDASTTNYIVEITLPIASDDIRPVGDPPRDLRIATSGTIKATGNLQVSTGTPSGYAAWAIAEGIPGADPDDDFNGDGVTNAFAWAYGFGKSDDASAFRPMALSTGGFQIPLPPGGTVTPITVRVSSNLGGFSDLPTGRISGSQNPLPTSSSGTFTVTPSGNPSEFLVLEVDTE